MTRQPFHHGNLRNELLARAEVVLRQRGVEHVSLRELAREAGVSHGAPRSHFIDRSALLDALAERGFDRLVHVIEDSVKAVPSELDAGPDLLRAAARAYLGFASQNAALVSLMVAAKSDNPSQPVYDAAMRVFNTLAALVTDVVGHRLRNADKIERLTLLLSATIQGVSLLVVSGRVAGANGDVILEDAVCVFIAGAFSIAPQ